MAPTMIEPFPDSPSKLFQRFFTPDLVGGVAREINASVKEDPIRPSHWIDIDATEVYKFLAILIYMGRRCMSSANYLPRMNLLMKYDTRDLSTIGTLIPLGTSSIGVQA